MEQRTGTIVWERQYDAAGHSKNMQRFWRFYAGPVALLVVAVALLSGLGPASGILILFGGIGLLLYLWVWLSGRNQAANPRVTKDAGELFWGKRRVPIDQVSKFSTYTTSKSITLQSSVARASFGAARFVLVDGSDVEFLWADLDEHQLSELRIALERVLPGRWRSVEVLDQTD